MPAVKCSVILNTWRKKGAENTEELDPKKNKTSGGKKMEKDYKWTKFQLDTACVQKRCQPGLCSLTIPPVTLSLRMHVGWMHKSTCAVVSSCV